jgi:Ca-activated chloride channel family protein
MLQWLLILPVLVACWIIQHRYRRRVRRASPIAPRFLALSRRSSARTGAAVLILAVLCAGAMVFALTQPQAIVTAREAQYERQDLIIVLDRSVSMRARDIEPSRLVRATSEIRDFLSIGSRKTRPRCSGQTWVGRSSRLLPWLKRTTGRRRNCCC